MTPEGSGVGVWRRGVIDDCWHWQLLPLPSPSSPLSSQPPPHCHRITTVIAPTTTLSPYHHCHRTHHHHHHHIMANIYWVLTKHRPLYLIPFTVLWNKYNYYLPYLQLRSWGQERLSTYQRPKVTQLIRIWTQAAWCWAMCLIPMGILGYA